MIIFDILQHECPVGSKGERIRIFLSDKGYKQAKESEERSEMVIRQHFRVRKGNLYNVLLTTSNVHEHLTI